MRKVIVKRRIRFLRVPAVRGGCCLLAIVSLIPQLVFADIIALRDGTRIEGTVANRELVALNPEKYDHLSVLVGETGEFKRILVLDIKYVLLVDGPEKRLLEFVSASAKASKGSPRDAAPRPKANKRDGGIAMIILGAGAGGLGALTHLGGEKATVTATRLKHEEKT